MKASISVIALMAFVIWKVYRRHKGKMEPIHMLQIYFLIEVTLLEFINIFLISYGIEHLFPDPGIYCLLMNFFNYYTILSMFSSSSILHYEKYQFLFIKTKYTSRLDCQAVWDRIISSKIIIFFVTAFGYHLGKLSKMICKKHMEFFICWFDPLPPLTYGKSATFFISLK